MSFTIEGVDMQLLMDDVPPGTADAAVNGGHPAGDCLRACVATVLGLPLDDVPHFVQYVEHPAGTDPWLWWWALVGFCHSKGWAITYDDGAPDGWSLACGPSNRGHQHVVVARDGAVVFDPHPSRAGVLEVTGWMGLRKAGTL